MRAWVYERYGPPEVVELREVAKPTPGQGQILVKGHATAVTAGDWRVRSLDVPAGFGLMSRLIFGVLRPRKKVLGTVMAGEVVAVGSGVTRFSEGDAVLLSDDGEMGCHAEFKKVAADGAVVAKPDGLSFEDAAALPFGGATALHFLELGKVREGERVLVNGASGEVGTACVQLAKHLGAEVTGVCSTPNVELVESIGADNVIDYTKADFTQNGELYDAIIDTAATAGFSRSKSSLTERGRLLVVNGDLAAMLKAPFVNLVGKKKLVSSVATASAERLQRLVHLAVEGELKPVIGKRFAFDQLVEAHRLVDTGHKVGSVVVTFEA